MPNFLQDQDQDQDIEYRVHNLSSAFNLNDEQTQDLLTLCLDIAREQYKAGNQSGVAWKESQE